MNHLTIHNHQTIALEDIPRMAYADFYDLNTGWIKNSEHCHCVNYFGHRTGKDLLLICCVADDATGSIYVSAHPTNGHTPLESMTAVAPCYERFERELHENFGIPMVNHPWLKPVRYPHHRADQTQTMDTYPFYSIDSEELHEVGVGPIHAGIIEPGHFRFICNGEQILHLEIQLGYQHRGIEALMVKNKNLLRRATLAEAIAGDTAIGHTTTFCNVWESLSQWQPTPDVVYARTLALELERMAIHTGDLSAACTDVAYQLGSSVLGRLRTPIINFMQEWGGNRLNKGFVRPGQCVFPFTPYLSERLTTIFTEYERDFNEIMDEIFQLPSALSRFERTGVVSTEDARAIGAVGMVARTCGMARDIRSTHPTGLYATQGHVPIVKHHGDVYARVSLRREEIAQSMAYVREWMNTIPESSPRTEPAQRLQPNAFTLSLTEGWRGEICHCAITDDNGDLATYKIKDPSFHNWMALALAVRNNEISDFPICNKSFNLSYAGHDL
ncbi:MAG: NADH-quinone oxidoreductase subunit C [Marinilabiliaceae bacterium]|nr:NADH-quinone oxidoreductase subunit C [Marinilabiliaceae bacterium]